MKRFTRGVGIAADIHDGRRGLWQRRRWGCCAGYYGCAGYDGCSGYHGRSSGDRGSGRFVGAINVADISWSGQTANQVRPG